MPPITVTLYTRPGCHLCDQARQDLQSLQSEVAHTLVEIDIEQHPEFHKKYLESVPVVEVGPYRKAAPFTRADLLMTLRAGRDRQAALEQLDPPGYAARVQRGRTESGGDRLSLWVARHYLAFINLLLLLYVGLPFLAPVFMQAGVVVPARVIYTVYSPLCHELGFRSFFLFGEQPYYPRAAAGVEGLKTFGEATGLDEGDILAARSYVGGDRIGYKVALCERDVFIYGSLLAFGLVFAATGRRWPRLHWLAWFLVGILPMGLDGFSQLFSQLGLPFIADLLPLRESTPLLRMVTGALFGFMTGWFVFPYVEESMQETRALLVKKAEVIGQTRRRTGS